LRTGQSDLVGRVRGTVRQLVVVQKLVTAYAILVAVVLAVALSTAGHVGAPTASDAADARPLAAQHRASAATPPLPEDDGILDPGDPLQPRFGVKR
jgi:hypothetical protein